VSWCKRGAGTVTTVAGLSRFGRYGNDLGPLAIPPVHNVAILAQGEWSNVRVGPGPQKRNAPTLGGLIGSLGWPPTSSQHGRGRGPRLATPDLDSNAGQDEPGRRGFQSGALGRFFASRTWDATVFHRTSVTRRFPPRGCSSRRPGKRARGTGNTGCRRARARSFDNGGYSRTSAGSS